MTSTDLTLSVTGKSFDSVHTFSPLIQIYTLSGSFSQTLQASRSWNGAFKDRTA